MTRVVDKLGRPLRDLRISLIDRCNLRCTYCMPAEVFGPDYAFLKGDQLLTFEEIHRLTRAFTRLGACKVRLTGGEPLLRKGIVDLVARLHRVPMVEDLALTTNAVLLPRFARELAEAGLHRVTVSLDAIDETIFGEMNGGRTTVAAVLAGISAARDAGLPVKINMVVERGVNESQVVPMAAAFRDRGINLRFIEFMDVGNHNGWSMDQVYPARQIVEDLAVHFPIEPLEANYRGEVARRYRYTDNGGEFGIIASVTQPFCSDCNRARLSADGNLYTCLFADQGWELRDLLRADASEEELHRTLLAIWTKRRDRYSELREEILRRHRHPHKVEMSYIGG